MMSSTIYLLLVSLACSILLVQATSIDSFVVTKQRRATTCNGSSDLCNRLYSNVTYAGAHNSYAIESGSQEQLAANQNTSIAQQLDAGIRLLQSQAHSSTNSSATGAGIDLCHTSCSLFQGGALEQYLGEVKQWSDSNPNEVLTLLIVNSDSLPASQFAQAFQSTGLADKMYSASAASLTRNQWPTLGSLIDSGKPIVGFITAGSDLSSVPYLLDEFSNIWETPFGQTSVPFNCSIDRIGQSVSDSSSIMYLANQFRDNDVLGSGSGITVPDRANIGTTNSEETTLQSANNCAGQHGNVYPTFILTDFSTTPNYDFLRAVAELNGVSYTAPTSSTNSNGESSSSSPNTSAVARLKVKSSVETIALFVVSSILLAWTL